MGQAILGGIVKSPEAASFTVTATVRSSEQAKKMTEIYSVPCHTDSLGLVKESDVIILGVLPNQAQDLLEGVSSELTRDKLLISICAGVKIQDLLVWSGGQSSVVRAMPNTPCLIGEGMTLLCADSNDQKAEKLLSQAETIFSRMGQVVRVEERMLNSAMAISGCGPAFVYMIIEALSDAGVMLGISRKVATALSAQTLRGASQMVLSTPLNPAYLKEQVTSPGGCTIQGVYTLEKGNLRATLMDAVIAAEEKASEMDRNKSS